MRRLRDLSAGQFSAAVVALGGLVAGLAGLAAVRPYTLAWAGLCLFGRATPDPSVSLLSSVKDSLWRAPGG